MLADIKGLAPLLVFAVIIVIQVIRALMQKAAQAQQAQRQPQRKGWAAPRGEVRRFLEELTGQPVAAPQAPKREPRRRRAKKPAPQPEERVQTRQRIVEEPEIILLPATDAKYQFDVQKLRNPESLRDAIVVREILDRPLALRRRRPGPR